MRQAYLIIAHNKIEQLKFLISLLDYEKHDIFILFDKKAKITEEQKNEMRQVVTKSDIFFTREIPIYWGDYSQVEAEMILFETAAKNGKYSMYHLLSGVDLPLDTAERIYNFFDSKKEFNFLTMVSEEIYYQNRIYERVAFRIFVPKLNPMYIKNKLFKNLLKIYRRLENKVQRILKIDFYKKYNLTLKYASNWCSLNDESVNVLIKEKDYIEKVFRNTIVNDELFIPTILNKNNLLHTVYSQKTFNDSPNDFQGNLRYINWWDGSPYTWMYSEEDIKQIKSSKENGYLFSRKFDLERYPEWKNKILEIINEKQN
ncbi:beta-1,6-N-acetylglucosaminyltransferase [Streptococcus mitis]|uniref:Peptide O-xylosyltransferase n=1 Tax=Streptococcus mitis TaxID=28037 RepID=A0A428CL39_STRMT|nr:beta-1,6-N-acetylglucosaminyltransferase [Streptococcus mitis]RSI78770.1 Core-2/I-Branching enzyme [Streptococcus mitis]